MHCQSLVTSVILKLNHFGFTFNPLLHSILFLNHGWLSMLCVIWQCYIDSLQQVREVKILENLMFLANVKKNHGYQYMNYDFMLQLFRTHYKPWIWQKYSLFRLEGTKGQKKKKNLPSRTLALVNSFRYKRPYNI